VGAFFPTGTLAERPLGPPTALRAFPQGTTAGRVWSPYQFLSHGQKLAELEILARLEGLEETRATPYHILFYGHIGRASSFAEATEDKDARPSRGIARISSGHGGGQNASGQA